MSGLSGLPLGLPLDRAKGLPNDRAKGLPLDQASGLPNDRAKGLPLDQASGLPLDWALGLPLDQALLAMAERGLPAPTVTRTAAPEYFAARDPHPRPDTRVVRARPGELTVAAFREPSPLAAIMVGDIAVTTGAAAPSQTTQSEKEAAPSQTTQSEKEAALSPTTESAKEAAPPPTDESAKEAALSPTGESSSGNAPPAAMTAKGVDRDAALPY